MTENEIATCILDKAFAIHKSLGPGLLESVYEKALEYELIQNDFYVQCQFPVPMFYKQVKFEAGFRMDLLVEDKVVVEIKSIAALAPVHFSQLLTYLRLSDKKLGLLINFNTKYLREGVHRIVNGL
ncbi:GxxExxY protein [Cyclobacterium salsum]|uniref:GxxExxY protein n=1 Tax=Cyclobacterium salsum TaxID=2666329 RepID=UPI0013914AC7|nr:GxxExxY protein [Cyclobacterium salsum]